MKLTIDQALQRAITAHNAGNLEEAERLYRTILRTLPTHPHANHNLGLIALSVNNTVAALPLFKKALEENPRIEQFWLSYVDALTKESQFKNARRVIKKAKKMGFSAEKFRAVGQQLISSTGGTTPPQSELDSLLQFYQTGRSDDAEKLAISLTQKFPKHAFSWKILGALFGQTDRQAESLNANQKAVALSLQDAEAHNNLGVSLQKQGRLEEAEASFRQAIVLKPDYAGAHRKLGGTLHELSNLDEAESSYRRAIECKPDYHEAHSELGNTLQEQGRLVEAEATYRQAIALNPDFSEARHNLGVLLFEDKQYDVAAEQFALSNIQQSKWHAVKCSYHQSEEVIFYDQLDFLIAQGEINAVIGSLSCCSEVKFGVKKSNPFCTDPLRYVVTTDLNKRYAFEDVFIETARDLLTDESLSYRSQGHLTNGTQTAGNIFALEKVSGTEIENIIHAEVERYRGQFKDSDEGFTKSWPTSYSIRGWLVCMQSGGQLAAHIHDTGWITGSIYINVPPKSEPNSGNLVLRLSDQENALDLASNQERIIDVVTGSLCLFPSSLHHHTIPFEEEENRIVLAFDVIPKR
jgi:tetratricopeptide (TPR) repeat protein